MVKVNSDFEGGSIGVVSTMRSTDIRLTIEKDNKSSARQWFYFSIETEKPCLQVIKIENAHEVSFAQSWLEYKAFASYDNVNWFRVETQFINTDLTLTLDANSTKVYYAYFVPYTSEREKSLFEYIKNFEHVQVHVLGHSPLGRELKLVQIGDDSETHTKVWLIARQHPGESMAQWMMESIIRCILNSPYKKDDVCFYIVLNMNPDGSAIGNHRTNVNGLDLNRQWNLPDRELCPEVFHVKNAMLQKGVDLFFDLHGDESLPYNFLMSENGHPFADHFKQQLEYASRYFQTKYDYTTTYIETNLCIPSNEADLKATSFVHSHFGVPAILIETSFKELNDGSNSRAWDNQTCMEFGDEFGKVLLNFFS